MCDVFRQACPPSLVSALLACDTSSHATCFVAPPSTPPAADLSVPAELLCRWVNGTVCCSCCCCCHAGTAKCVEQYACAACMWRLIARFLPSAQQCTSVVRVWCTHATHMLHEWPCKRVGKSMCVWQAAIPSPCSALLICNRRYRVASPGQQHLNNSSTPQVKLAVYKLC